MHLRQSTASQSVVIGPFVDSTDGNTAETGLTINASDIRLSKSGANIVGKNSGGGTHDELGYYTITLDATDTNTVGRLQLMVHVAGALPVYHEYEVIEEAVYDALYAASAVGPLLANSNGSGLTEAGGTGDHLTAVPWNASWDAEVQSECTDALNAYDPPTNAEMEARTLASASYATAAALATVDGNVDSILEDTGTTIPAAIGALNDLDATAVQTAAAAALTAYDPPTNAEMEARTLASADYATATDLATVDGNVDAIKLKTDSLTFTVAGQVDANTQSINDVTITGDGQVGTEFGV